MRGGWARGKVDWGWERSAKAAKVMRLGCMILGTGIDLVEIQRIREALGRHGEAFALRILTTSEWEYCRRHPDAAPHVAARFAAKEAVSKAFGIGIGTRLGWHDMEVTRDASGRPSVELSGEAASLMRERGGARVHLSLSHERGHAAAMAILEN